MNSIGGGKPALSTTTSGIRSPSNVSGSAGSVASPVHTCTPSRSARADRRWPSRARTVTRAPRAHKASTTPRPRPRLPPTTRTFRSFRVFTRAPFRGLEGAPTLRRVRPSKRCALREGDSSLFQSAPQLTAAMSAQCLPSARMPLQQRAQEHVGRGGMLPRHGRVADGAGMHGAQGALVRARRRLSASVRSTSIAPE